MIEQTRTEVELAATAGQWEYVSCHCIVKLGSGVTMSYECDVCGNTNLRFIHTLEHHDKRVVWVGIECARLLMQGSEIPVLAENETKRKETWRIHYRKAGRCVTTMDDLKNRGKV